MPFFSQLQSRYPPSEIVCMLTKTQYYTPADLNLSMHRIRRVLLPAQVSLLIYLFACCLFLSVRMLVCFKKGPALLPSHASSLVMTLGPLFVLKRPRFTPKSCVIISHVGPLFVLKDPLYSQAMRHH